MKKIISILIAVTFLFMLPATISSAYNSESLGNISTDTIEQHQILTRYSDGTSIESTYSFNPISYMSQYSLEGYNPIGNEITPLRSDSEELLTGTNVDPRVGKLKSYFDEDGDGYMDVIFEGTASLQSYDIAVSCAHMVWRKELQNQECEGWPLYIKFEAGRNGLNEGILADYSKISIGMNYVNNTVYDANEDKEYVHFNDDWCIITLDRNVGGSVGFLGIHGCGEPELGTEIYLIGYPVDRMGLQQFKTTGVINSFNDNIVYYSAYSSDGYSGGPVINSGFLYAINTGSSYVALGEENGYALGTRMAPWLCDMIAAKRIESAERWE